MSLLAFPNELLLQVAGNLDAKTTSSLLRANRRLAFLLIPLLHAFALHDELYCITALQSAAASGDKEMVKLLLEKSTVNFKVVAFGGYMRRSLFCRDATHSPTDRWGSGIRNIGCLAQKILDEGAKTLIYCLPSGRTPLQLAAERGNEAIVRFLLEKGVLVDIKEPFGLSALHCAALKSQRNTTKLLLESGANINLRQGLQQRLTPLDQAVLDANEVAVKFLLEFGANARSADAYGETPLHLAMHKPNQSIVKMLLDNGANINRQNTYGSTPLLSMVKISFPDISMIQFLLDNNANPDLFDQWGDNPLLWAIPHRYSEIVQLLVEKGADLSVQSAFGMSVTDLAKIFGVIALLEGNSGPAACVADFS